MKKNILRKILLILAGTGILAGALCGCQKRAQSNETPAENNQIPNPIVEYKSAAEVEKAIGYKPVELPASAGFILEDCEIIADTIVDFEYEEQAGEGEITLRMEKNAKDDFSGYQGISYTKFEDYEWAEWQDGDDKEYVAKYTKGDLTVIMSGSDMVKEQFQEIFAALIQEM